ncbi:hypothetical protein B0H14DRAFT_2609256 [Mycena olivaceomarginata]|nr:hypothetical protein B0H14DRAFT_2609256 [Mycena olivaceomarginata]
MWALGAQERECVCAGEGCLGLSAFQTAGKAEAGRDRALPALICYRSFLIRFLSVKAQAGATPCIAIQVLWPIAMDLVRELSACDIDEVRTSFDFRVSINTVAIKSDGAKYNQGPCSGTIVCAAQRRRRHAARARPKALPEFCEILSSTSQYYETPTSESNRTGTKKNAQKANLYRELRPKNGAHHGY